MKKPFDGEEEILQRLVTEMLALPSGTRISTAELVRRVYGDARKFNIDQLIQLSFDLRPAGRKAGIRFGDPYKEPVEIGLPFVGEFVIRHKN